MAIFRRYKGKKRGGTWRLHMLIPLLMLLCFLVSAASSWQQVNAPWLERFLTDYIYLPTHFTDFWHKPWTLFTFFFFHTNPVLLLINLGGYFIFSSLTSNLLGHKVVFPLFILGNITGALFLVIITSLPFARGLAIPAHTCGSGGGIMALLLASTFYIPLKIVRFYGLFPVKLKYVGMALPAISIIFLVAGKFADLQLQYLGGMFSGIFLAGLIRRGNVHPGSLRPVKKKKRTVPVLHGEAHTDAKKETAAGEEIVSPTEYVDYLLEKIHRLGMNSLHDDEKKYLDNYSKKL